MTPITADAALERRRIGAQPQHIEVVIALQQKAVTALVVIRHRRRDAAQIRQNTQPPPRGLEDELAGLAGIVGNSKGFYTQVADFECRLAVKVLDPPDTVAAAAGQGAPGHENGEGMTA